MAQSMKLTIRNVFADETTNTITIDNIDPQRGVAEDIKQTIMDFNARRGGNLSAKMKSKTGANWIGINRAVVTTSEREYIF